MEIFEQRKNEYFLKLKDNMSVIEKLKSGQNDPTKVDETMRVLLDPKNDDELTVANNLVTFFSDFVDLTIRLEFDDVKEIPLEENEGINLFANIIKLAKEDKKYNLIKKPTAKLLYDFLVGFLGDIDTTMDYIAEKTGFDLDDDIQIAQFALYINKTKGIFEDINFDATNPDIIDSNNINELSQFCNEFHELCEKGKLDKGKPRTLTDKNNK